MPRRPKTDTTPTNAATLERQAATDSQLAPEVDDESWRDQTIPTFDDAPSEASTNGHVVDGGVRPSEQCRTPSPLGIGCTERSFHSGPHSWGPFPAESADPGTTIESEKQEQATLPGTPELPAAEPEPTDYDIPWEGQFNGADFQSAPGIKAIAERLIADTEEFAHLRGITIRYFWKRRGGLKGGNPRLGNLQRPTGLAAYSLGRPQFALWLGADHCRDAKLTAAQMEALIFSQLCKGAVDPDDHSAFRIVGPDVEMFALELRTYGLWSADIREAAASLRQLPLDQELDLVDEDDDSDDDADETEADDAGD